MLAAAFILFPEDLLDFLLTVFHYTFEGFEYLLEEVIQHVFHIGKETSQLYVFYILMAMGVGATLFIGRKTPQIYRYLKRVSWAFIDRQKQRIYQFWEQLSWLQKILFFAFYMPFFLYLSSFLVM